MSDTAREQIIDEAWDQFRLTPGIRTGSLSYVTFKKVVAAALAAERATVWDKVICYLNSQERKPLLSPLSDAAMAWNDAQEVFVDWCRQQAERKG